jgi:hypothetical protein
MDSNAKATIVAAVIGGVFLCFATVIGLFSPLSSRLWDRFLATATFTPSPTNTLTATPAATLTPTTVPTETPNPSLVFLVYNNYEQNQDLYVDGVLKAAVDIGAYATFRLERGQHLLQNCVRGKNPQVNATDCVGRTYVVQDDPFFWELTGNQPPHGNATFIVRNISKLNIDFYVDGKQIASIDRATYIVAPLAPGIHILQACPRGFTPTANPDNCGSASRFDVETAVQSWTIHD